jgi:hypothetical protein
LPDFFFIGGAFLPFGGILGTGLPIGEGGIICVAVGGIMADHSGLLRKRLMGKEFLARGLGNKTAALAILGFRHITPQGLPGF